MKNLIGKIVNALPLLNPILDFDSVSKHKLKSLYKFTYFDSEQYYKDLLKNIFFFPAKSQLNDPFDANIPTRYDLCKEKELDKHLGEIIKRKENNVNSLSKKISEAKERIKKDSQSSQKMIDEFIEQKVGIFSLSEKNDNPLLWSHYSSKHTGFCVELDAQLLNKIIIEEFNKNNDMAFLFKVKYQNKFPIINPCKQSIERRTQLQFLVKSKDWKYEEEWRVLLLNGSKQKRELPPNIIKNIFFGINTIYKNIHFCKELLMHHNPNIGLYKAEIKKNAFGFNFTKI